MPRKLSSKSDRGVFREVSPFADVAEFRIVNSRGKTLMRVEVDASEVDDSVKRWMHGWLRAHDTALPLRVID